jgi:hypothetical protein
MHLFPHSLLYEGNAAELQSVLARQVFGRRPFPFPSLVSFDDIDAVAGGAPGDSDQAILPRNAFGRHPLLVPRLKAGTNVTITQRADEFEIASTGGGAAGDSDQTILPVRNFTPRFLPAPVIVEELLALLAVRTFGRQWPIPWWVQAGIFGFHGDVVVGNGNSAVAIVPALGAGLDVGSTTKPLRQGFFAGNGAAAAALQVVQQTAPTSPVDGDIWHDATRDTLQAFVAGIKHTLGGVLFNSTASVTHQNSITETSLVGSGIGTMTLPAAILVAGKKLRFRASGVMVCDAVTPGTMAFTLYHNTSVSTVTTTQTPPLLGVGTERKWSMELDLTIRSSTTCIGQGWITIASSGVAAAVWEFGTGDVAAAIAAGLVDFKLDWQVADADNILTCTNFSMEVLG